MTKHITPEQVGDLLSPGNKVFIQGGIGEPQTLLAALAAHTSAGDGVDFYSVMVPGVNDYNPCDFHVNARFHSIFIFGKLFESMQRGRTFFYPLHYSEVIDFFNQLPAIDHIIIQVSQPDQNGYCSLGPTVDFVPAIIDKAQNIIAEINVDMPPTIGSLSIAYDKIDYAIDVKHKLPSNGSYSPSEISDRIANYVTDLIDDGDTLQFGIGTIPSAVLQQLRHHRRLGLHSGMITEEVMSLIQQGIFTGENKSIDTGNHLTGFALGSESFYHWAAGCDTLIFRPVSYTHDIRVISALDNFVSINSALEVDLLGQVNVEMLNGKQISGTGGALDYVRGARLSRNGRSIIALPATAANGTKSRIVTRLDCQSVVSVPRNDVDYVVTEYGVAKLSHRSSQERMSALIDIAAPQFRDDLYSQV